MLDPSNDFNSPCYDDTFRRVFFFDEYNAHGEYFIELDYWIMREAYQSRIGKALDLDQNYYDDAGGGEGIFRDVSTGEYGKFQDRKYFLGEERIDVSTSKFGDIYKVTELYVYAPRNDPSPEAKEFISYESDICVFPQLKDYNTGLSKVFGNVNEYNIDFQHGLNLISVQADFLEVGDEFYLSRRKKDYGWMCLYEGCTPLMTVTSVNNGWATGVAEEFVFWNISYPIKAALEQRSASPITLHVFSKTYPQRSLQVKIKKTTEFFDKNTRISSLPPPVHDRFFPVSSLSGIEAPEINSSTIPNFTEYKAMVDNHSLINAKPSTIREIYPGLWMREKFETEAR